MAALFKVETEATAVAWPSQALVRRARCGTKGFVSRCAAVELGVHWWLSGYLINLSQLSAHDPDDSAFRAQLVFTQAAMVTGSPRMLDMPFSSPGYKMGCHVPLADHGPHHKHHLH